MTYIKNEVLYHQRNCSVFDNDMSDYPLLRSILHVFTTINFTIDPYLQAPDVQPLQLMIPGYYLRTLIVGMSDCMFEVPDLLGVHVWLSHLEVTDLR